MQAGYEVATYRPSRTSSRARHRGRGPRYTSHDNSTLIKRRLA